MKSIPEMHRRFWQKRASKQRQQQKAIFPAPYAGRFLPYISVTSLFSLPLNLIYPRRFYTFDAFLLNYYHRQNRHPSVVRLR